MYVDDERSLDLIYLGVILFVLPHTPAASFYVPDYLTEN